MDKNHLKLIIENQSEISKKDKEFHNGQTNPVIGKIRNISLGAFYLVWIISIPGLFSCLVSIVLSWENLEKLHEILIPSSVLFFCGIILFSVIKLKPIEKSE